MHPKYILTADDFGPVDFINQGILEHVEAKKINSVQVLVNGDTESSLTKKLLKLAKVVPDNTVLDLGVHLTLTSGRPLYRRNSADSTIKNAWDKMVEKKTIAGFNSKKYVFKDFKKFYLAYVDGKTDLTKKHLYDAYRLSIQSEFELQTDRLATAVKSVNASTQTSRLAFTSISCHHNIVAVNDDLYEIYAGMAQYNNRNLSIRAPKVIPAFRSKFYTAVVLQIANSNITREQSDKMMAMNRAFLNNRYAGAMDLAVRSPSYSDMRHYSGGGSLGFKRKIKERKIRNTKAKLDRMISFSEEYKPVRNSDPQNNKVVELVFHLGGISKEKLATKSEQKKSVAHYPGIAWKYFDNRKIEGESLCLIKNQGKHSRVFNNLVSWNDCGIVTYKKS
jgi:YdjC-like protein